jgi:hypothetical protein
MLDYYDQILVAIAVVMLAGVAASLSTSLALYEGLAGVSLISTFLLYEILFRNPPTDPTTSTTTASVVVGVGWLLTVALSL